nr:MAG TPA: hypothetical protein [Caudoviricetes sp.]
MRFGIRSYKKIRRSSSPGYEVKLSEFDFLWDLLMFRITGIVLNIEVLELCNPYNQV